jgi:hypothetical protein
VRGFRRTQLAFDIVETADVLGKGALEGTEVAIELRGVSVDEEGPGEGVVWSYISKLDEAELAEGVDDFAADFIGYVELDHAHVRRAERRVPCGSHLGMMAMDGATMEADAPRRSMMSELADERQLGLV